ncbi:MAG: FecR family protein [Chitinophagaceae bacterium]|nr:FecR family protein [Chitinophagaceae bacterium]
MDSRYRIFTFEEFLTDPYFVDSVKKPVEESEIFWEEFISLYPEQKSKVETAKDAVRLLILATDDKVQEQDKNEIWEGIAARQKSRTFLPVRWKRWAAVVAIVFLSAGGWLYLNEGVKRESDMTDSVTWPVFPGSGGVGSRSILLPDHTEVTLAPGSELRVDPNYDRNSRRVSLSGEAEFHVSRNESKPFRVYSSGLITQVLGTRFRIIPQKDQILVDVTSGRVSLVPAKSKEQKTSEALILTRNQRGIFQRMNQQLTRTLVDKPSVDGEPTLTNFRNIKIDVIFKSLETAYGVKIEYDAAKLDRCRLTTSLPSNDLKGSIDVLCAALGASYQIVDARIVIVSPGCL